MPRCPNCRREVKIEADVCSYCGTSLGGGEQSSERTSRSQSSRQPSSQGQSAQRGGDQGQKQPQGSRSRSQVTQQPGNTQSQQQSGATVGEDESIVDALSRRKPQQYIKGIIAMMASLGLFLSVGIFLVGNIGGRSLVPGLIQELGDLGVEGVTVGDVISFTHELRLAYYANEISIFLAFMMAPIVALLVILQMNDTPMAKIGTAAVGVGIGTLIFMLLVVTAASLVVPDVNDLGEFDGELDDEFGGATAGTIDLGSVDFSNLLINSILIAIVTAGASGSVVYFNERFLI